MESPRRYARVPVALVSLLAVLAIFAWVLGRGGEDRESSAGPRDTVAAVTVPTAVPVPTGSPGAPAASRPAADPSPAAPPAPEQNVPGPGPQAVPQVASVPGDSVSAAPPAEQYALESGPFLAAPAADRREEELNRLGFATTRFRRQDVARVYIVAATGFTSMSAAEAALRQLGTGTIVEQGDAIEVVVDRVASLHQAIEVARTVRVRGLEARVREDSTPTIIYHIRYGQFTSDVAARARAEELERLGIPSRVVRVR